MNLKKSTSLPSASGMHNTQKLVEITNSLPLSLHINSLTLFKKGHPCWSSLYKRWLKETRMKEENEEMKINGEQICKKRLPSSLTNSSKCKFWTSGSSISCLHLVTRLKSDSPEQPNIRFSRSVIPILQLSRTWSVSDLLRSVYLPTKGQRWEAWLESENHC